jgi:hypothetical protein
LITIQSENLGVGSSIFFLSAKSVLFYRVFIVEPFQRYINRFSFLAAADPSCVYF